MRGIPGAQPYMAKAERCLASAQTLLDSGDPDGACNRAYYAMYDAAQAALRVVSGTAQVTYKSHQGLLAAFGQQVVLGGHLDAEFGRMINEVQRFRQLADYTGDPIDAQKAVSAVTKAAAFVAAVREKFVSPES